MRKQCEPGVSPPPSQTPGYEAIQTCSYVHKFLALRISVSEIIQSCTQCIQSGIASELMQGQQLILTFCVTEQESLQYNSTTFTTLMS